MRHRVIHLTGAIAAAANKRQYLAGMRVKCDQCHLRIGVWLAQLLVARMHPVHLCVHHVNRRVDGLSCDALQIRIERGVDAQALAVEVAIAESLRKLIVHQVYE